MADQANKAKEELSNMAGTIFFLFFITSTFFRFLLFLF